MGLLALALVGPAEASSLKVVYTYEGNYEGVGPLGAVVSSGGYLYGTTASGGNYNYGAIYRIDPSTGQTTTVYSFTGGADGGRPNEGGPQCALIASGGLLYGVEPTDIHFGNGNVFSFDPATGALKVLHSFQGGKDGASPIATLTSDGQLLYGVTNGNQQNAGGSIFSVDPTTGAVTTLYWGSNAGTSYQMTAVGGVLYGINSNLAQTALFAFHPEAKKFDVLYTFNGNPPGLPGGALTAVNGKLFGVAGSALNQGSSIFKFDPAAGTITFLQGISALPYGAFQPPNGLIFSGGVLYGLAGPASNGIPSGLFSYDLATGVVSSLANFSSGPCSGVSALIVINGTLYGTQPDFACGNGKIFSYDIASEQQSLVHSFVSQLPRSNSALLSVDNLLYGTTSDGGTSNHGAVLAINPVTGVSRMLVSFSGGVDGNQPISPLLRIGTELYGTTTMGGTQGLGNVFATNLSSGSTTVLHSFAGGTDGIGPTAALLNIGGLLFGTTPAGATNGTVFKLNPSTGIESVIYGFADANSYLDGNSSLFSGGGYVYGVRYGSLPTVRLIYSVNYQTGADRLLSSFQEEPGDNYPVAGLTNLDGVLYGTTFSDGPAQAGTLFKIDRITGRATVLHSFNGADGYLPVGGLLNVGGLLYGTTRTGVNGYGNIFSFNPTTGQLTSLYAFTGGADGAYPANVLTLVGSTIYGNTTLGASFNKGAVFAFTP